MQPQFLDDVEKTSAGDQGDASEESDNNDDDDDDDDVSLGPPPSLPLVLVNLERLCGFVRQVNKRRTNCAIKL